MRIGIFDSGIGGVNVLASLIKKYPYNEYIYFGDTKNLPYGNKSKDELLKLASHCIDFLLTKNVDIIIVACGTISSNCFQELKEKYSVPIYDIISPTIDYLMQTDFKKIGVIGTKKTIESNIFNLKEKSVLMHATPSFVPIIENNEIELKKKDIIKEISSFKNCDCLVLGCTHYPLIKDLIEDKLKIKTIDMGICLAKKIKLANKGQKKITLYFSKINNNLLSNINQIIKDKYELYAI